MQVIAGKAMKLIAPKFDPFFGILRSHKVHERAERRAMRFLEESAGISETFT